MHRSRIFWGPTFYRGLRYAVAVLAIKTRPSLEVDCRDYRTGIAASLIHRRRRIGENKVIHCGSRDTRAAVVCFPEAYLPGLRGLDFRCAV